MPYSILKPKTLMSEEARVAESWVVVVAVASTMAFQNKSAPPAQVPEGVTAAEVVWTMRFWVAKVVSRFWAVP